MALSSINIVLNAITDAFNRNIKKAADTMDASAKRMGQSADAAGTAIENSLGSGQLRQKIKQVSDTIDEQKNITREFQAELEKLRQKRDSMSKMDIQGQKAVKREIEATKTALKDQSLAVSQLTATKQQYTQQLGVTNQTLGGTRAALNGLATSFSAVSSVIGIMADDNKALRNTLMALNAALNFSAAIMQVKDLQEQFGGLTKFLTNPWVLAAVAIAATAAAVYAYNSSISQTEQIQNDVNNELIKAAESAKGHSILLNEYLGIVNDTNQSERVRLGALKELEGLGIAIDGINIMNADSLNELNQRVQQNINLTIQKAIADRAAAKIAEIEMEKIDKLNKIRTQGASLLGKMREKFLPGYIASVNESADAMTEAEEKTKLYTQAFKDAAKQVATFTDIETQARKNSEKVSNSNAKAKANEAKEIEKLAEKTKKAEKDLIDWLEAQRYKLGEKAKKESQKFTMANMMAGTAKAPTLEINYKISDKSRSQIVQDMDALNATLAQSVEKLGEDLAIGLGEALGNALSGEGNPFEDFAKVILGSIASFIKMVGKSLIAYGISVQKFYSAFVNPAAAVAAGIAMVAMGTAVASQIKSGPSVPAFAEGGIVSGPTLGLMGEYPGASSNPEVIAPLDKLKTLMKPEQSSVGFVASTSIQGRDLAIVLERYNKDSKRG